MRSNGNNVASGTFSTAVTGFERNGRGGKLTSKRIDTI